LPPPHVTKGYIMFKKIVISVITCVFLVILTTTCANATPIGANRFATWQPISGGTYVTCGSALRMGADDTGYDFICFGATASKKAWWDASGDEWFFGADDEGVDVTFYGDTASQKAWWDASGDEWFFGANGEGVDVTFYGDTASSYAKWDEDSGTNGALILDAADIALGDGDYILFGDTLGTGDISLSSTSAVFTIGQVVAGTGEVRFGVNDAGLDFTLFGDTDGEYLLWDTSEDTLTGNLGNVSFTTNDAEADQVKFDATGAVAGNAINFETTDGGILFNADGGTNGDIELNAADQIKLITADPCGVLVTSATFDHKYKYYNISAGPATATEVRVSGGQGLLCVGLTAGAAETGSTEGYVGIDDAADFLRFEIQVPDYFVDTGVQGDVIVQFDIDEQAAEECNIDVRIFEYDDATNTTAILTDTIVADNDGTRAWKSLVSNAAGIGNESDLSAEDTLIFEITSATDADDFNLYGMRILWRVGIQATQ